MKKTSLLIAIALLLAFVFWTVAVESVDIQTIGPLDSAIGFAALNSSFHKLTGVHLSLYIITDWLSLVPVAFVLFFATLGLTQWIQRKSFLKVDRSILVLGAFYTVTLAVYLFFEYFVINYRPILINGHLEASYPSSTTLLVLCIMPTAMMQLQKRIQRPLLRKLVSATLAVFIVFMVMGRLLSGAHWLTDIIGGILISSGLVMLYHNFSE